MKSTEEKLKEIKKIIRLSENGVVVETMQRLGLNYKENRGVSVVKLKEIAKQYKNDSDLAKKLRQAGNRELLILSALIDNPNLYSLEDIEELMKIYDKQEFIEQFSINFLQNHKNAFNICLKNIYNEDITKKTISFLTLSLIVRENSYFDEKKNKIINKIKENIYTDFKPLLNSLSRLMRNIALISKEDKSLIMELFSELNNSQHKNIEYLKQEVLELIKY